MLIIMAILIGTTVSLILLVTSLVIERTRLESLHRDLLDRLLEINGTRPLTPNERQLVDTAQKEVHERKEKSRIRFPMPRT